MGHKKNKKVDSDEEEQSQSCDNIENSVTDNVEDIRKPKKSRKKRLEQLQIKEELITEPDSMEIPNEIIKEKRKKEKKQKYYNYVGETNPVPEDEENLQADQCNEASVINDSNVDDGIQPEVSVKAEKVKNKKHNNNLDEEKVIDWPEKDLNELFKRMEAAIPDKDTLAYSTRAEKLNWDEISFKRYTGEECKGTWLLVQKRLRRFRVLNELLQDAKEWITKPWTNFYGGQKTKRHPDMPRRPLSTYMLFYLHKKDKIIAENPGLEMTEISKIITQMYKVLSPAKREKYNREAAEKRKIYEVEIEEFYRQHPEIPRNVDKNSHHKPLIETGPKKPNTPFNLYYENQLKALDQNIYVDKHTFKDQCKEQWKNMSDKKKVIWINWAVDEETKYLDELKNYMSQNPDFVPTSVKPVLTKEEKTLREKMAGKPTKPPNSAYSLFSRMMLQSVEIKEVNPKDRMVVIAEKWKTCSEEERKEYSERILHLREQYKLDFASYLESLPEEKRQEELRSTMPKRKRSISKNEEIILKRKKSDTDVTENNNIKEKALAKKIKQEVEEYKPSKNKKHDDMECDSKKSDDSESKKDEDSDSKKLNPFSKPPYWNRMKKEEKRTFTNAMLKLKEHLDSRFENYINSRASDSSEDDSDDSDGSDSSSSSS